MQIFLLKLLDSQHAYLDENESKHCVKVLRHTRGDLIHCIDGLGTKYQCRIGQASLKRVELSIESQEKNWGEPKQTIRLAISPLRLKDRFEWAIEKAVELGVSEIHPIICQRTDLYKSKFKASRIETLLLTASKQCKRSKIPALFTSIQLEEFLERESHDLKLMGYCESKLPIQKMAAEIRSSTSATLLIGPEGDFTEKECKLAQEKGATLISLGENRLRTETAAVYALSSLKYVWAF